MLQPVRRAAPARGAGVESKLALVEFLLSSEDLGACVGRALDWLAASTPPRVVVCLLADANPPRHLRTVGARGERLRDPHGYSVDLEERSHPLMRALSGALPIHFERGQPRPETPLAQLPFHAVPLRSDDLKQELAVGLLLVGAATPQPDPEVLWAARALGEKLVRLRLRQALAEAERTQGRERSLLYGILNAVTDPVLLTDTEGKLIIANARAEKLFAAPEDASEGRRRAVQLNNMLFTSALSSTAVEHELSRYELLLVDPIDGSDLMFELIRNSVTDPREGTGIVSILRNVTELGQASAEIDESYRKLRMAEADVRAERHRIELIIDSVADPIVVTEPAGDVVLMNKPAEKLFSVSDNSAPAAERVVRANDAHLSSFVGRMLASGTDQAFRGEFVLVEPRVGKPVPVEAVASKVLSEQGQLTAVVTILHDRTEALEKGRLYEQLKSASEELEVRVRAATAELAQQNELLRRQHIALEQASAAKSQFLANISHEIRTPLNAILGYTSILLHGVHGRLGEPQRKSLQRVDANARHLLGLISDILDISRIEAGRMPLHISQFDLGDLFAEVMSELEPIISRSNLKVANTLATRIPPLRSDRQKIKQVVVNLLSNALKFTHQGSIELIGRYDRNEKFFAISVKDTGIGIAEHDQEKVWEDFQQIDNSPARAYGGTGLGLAICRRLALTLEGRLTLQSQVGKGSTFTLYLPRRLRRK